MNSYRPYYTLLACDDLNSPWRIEFGSTYEPDVTFERDDYVEKGYKRAFLRIITTHDSQAAINERVAYLNKRVAIRAGS